MSAVIDTQSERGAWSLNDVSDQWLDEIERRLTASCERCAGASLLLRDMTAFHLATGGKRLRALIPVWVCGNLGGDAAAAVSVGVGLELLHNATLVHDDLQDGDQTRRGQQTVWRRWGAAQAINAGDALYFQGLAEILTAPGGARCAALASDALIRVIEGQAMEFQLQLPRDNQDAIAPTVEAWMHMAGGKTAALFAACMASGGVCAGADDATIEALGLMGEQIGLLFQVQDDYLDIVGDKGRERRATDLAEGKLSFPVTWALTHGGAQQVARLAEIIATPRADTTDAMIDEGSRILEESGALAATSRWLRETAQRIEASELARVVPGLVERILAPVATALAAEP